MAAGIRAALVERTIAGHGPRGVLELLTVEDRTGIARHAVTCSGQEYLSKLLATTALPAELFEPHATCRSLDHQQALVVNPLVPTGIAIGAMRHASATILAGSDQAGARNAWGMLTAIVTGRGWLPADEVGHATAGIAEAALDLSNLWASERPARGEFRGWTGTDMADTIALALSEAPGLEPLPEPLRTRAIGTLSSQGFLVSGSLIEGLPRDAMIACAQAVRARSDFRALAQPHFRAVIDEFDEEARVIAARHGSESMLRVLVSDPNIRVRQHVARNPRTPRDVLATLAADPVDKVASQVARNTHVDEGLLLQLASRGGAMAVAATRALMRRLA